MFENNTCAKPTERDPTLAEIEKEVLVEGREWTHQRWQQKLQERADRISQNFPIDQDDGCIAKKGN